MGSGVGLREVGYFDCAGGVVSTASAGKLLAAADEHDVNIKWVLETHVHADHLSAAAHIREQTGAKIGIGAGVRAVQHLFGPVFGADDVPASGDFDRLFDDGDTFALGDLTVRPALRQVVCADNSEHILEPRVMQVLVALARAQGGIVSRDKLIEQCWEGRIVGEDAINRVIGRLRQFAQSDAANAFRIETVPRVGYRLLLRDQPEPQIPAAAVPRLLADLERRDRLTGELRQCCRVNDVSGHVAHLEGAGVST